MVVASSKWRKSRIQRNRTSSTKRSNEVWCICFDSTPVNAGCATGPSKKERTRLAPQRRPGRPFSFLGGSSTFFRRAPPKSQNVPRDARAKKSPSRAARPNPVILANRTRHRAGAGDKIPVKSYRENDPGHQEFGRLTARFAKPLLGGTTRIPVRFPLNRIRYQAH